MRYPAPRDLQAFVVTAQFGSLTAAGSRLALSVPALSRRLAALEDQLGVRLFERDRRGVTLTAAGTLYLAHAEAILERMRLAAAAVQPMAETVRVTTIPALATRWLLPRLAAFHARHPGVEVEIRTSVAFDRVSPGEFDFAIRLAPNADMAGAALLPIRVVPVWSAAHLGAIYRPEEVLRHPLLGPDHRPEFWAEWLRAMGLPAGAARVRPVDPLLLYEQAVGGGGIAIGIEPLVDRLLAEGRLTSLHRHRTRSERSFFLLEASGESRPAARRFRDWLRETAGPG